MISLVLLSSGSGSRMENSVPKQYLSLGGKPIIIHTLERLAKVKEINEVVICCTEKYMEHIAQLIENHCPQLNYKLVKGGKTRQESTWNGIQVCENESVMIHEAARPFVKIKEFERLAVEESENAIYGIEIPFTVLKGNGQIDETLDREQLVNVQLPQKFNRDKLIDAFEQAHAQNKKFTEDASLFFEYNTNDAVKILEGTVHNMKITYPMDLVIGETIYREYVLGSETN
ncbi:2-C-methyl-D-erythritol 4-phosphate cytidylyltransferase [Sporosarcina sp. Marseille-Q4063]|uniref:2-C-methyl-D-erythritol 4-phosphate cytidylyltransferase n=1 Tax=Sporosarcina sp. Marseille-Q4063 TaxID=2810514 RepID=UPI001BAEFA3E|nr:2-C-methyl-D-erythritol 4-phosphate cytidylyltransferase [Sporosarcina sp. Marseille-Q4063]QUW21226.1 2-C-methyl-D-erythritol 4-phosphate cytidylyltransferase [Sporosarcina sp. Marseille-Q4063]